MDIQSNDIIKSDITKSDVTKSIKSVKEKKANKPLCNHDYNDKNTSIRFMKKRKMVYPRTREGICPCCQQVFIINDSNKTKEDKKDKSVD